MIKYFKIYICLMMSFLFSSCFENDEQITPLPLNETDIPYSMYEYQTYFNISTKKIAGFHSYKDWDLGFESSKNGYHITLNYARFMYAGNTYSKDFYAVQSNISKEMKFDKSSGEKNSLVLNEWAEFTGSGEPVYHNYVFIIDRGRDEKGNEFGFKKIVFEKLEEDTFHIHYANLDNTEEHYFKVGKNKNTNFTLFSFNGGGQIKVSEPAKNNWDICFTKYSTIISDNYGNPTDYLVRGVYLNQNKSIQVALDTLNLFYEINSDLILGYSYSGKQDAIGYTWKVFENDAYKILDYHSYILKNINGKNYKLRFTDFFNDEGDRGYPSFELTEL